MVHTFISKPVPMAAPRGYVYFLNLWRMLGCLAGHELSTFASRQKFLGREGRQAACIPALQTHGARCHTPELHVSSPAGHARANATNRFAPKI
jgi:hypothetical protein